MPKVRVYQLAKELRVQSALILELLDRMGNEVKSDLSSLDEGTADLVRQRVTLLIEREKKRLEEERRLEKLRLEEEEKLRLEAEEEAKEPEEEEKEEAPAVEAPAEPPAPEAPAVPAAAAPKPVAATPPQSPAPEEPVVAPEEPAAGEPRRPRVFAAKRIPPLAERLKRIAKPPKAAARAKPTPPSGPSRPEAGRPAAGRAAAKAGTPPAVGVRRPAPPMPPPAKGRRKKKDKRAVAAQAVPRPKPELPPVPEEITLSEAVTVKELAEKLNRKSKDVIAKLLARGVLATINQPLDPSMAVEVAKEFGSTAEILTFEEEAQKEAVAEGTVVADRPEDLKPRPPVVTVMGHVDHGKTSLLDKIREANVVAREHGGITQHIGAYQVEKKGRKVTFLDTPGHEAFTMMRARGAKATDIVVLVVAADDGVKPQTLEAIDHAKAADVPIVVAINKIDKPESRPDRVKQQLAEHELVVEEYGGQIVSVEVSAKQGIGIDDLLEMILLVADLQEFKANPNKFASGVVLEARVDRARGIVATVLVQEGSIGVGDPFIAGTAYGKVRAMSDDRGDRIDRAGPSVPVEVMGFSTEPAAGDLFQAVADEAKSRQIASFRQEKARAETLQADARRTLEDFSRKIADGEVTKELPILLKCDVRGSVEALQDALGKLPSDKIKVNVLRASTGAISQADVLLAAASNAIIVGFNVRPDRATADLARRENVEIRLYTVIYDLIDEIKQAMVGMLEPTLKENYLGQAEVRQIFKVPKVGTVAGCSVVEGKATRVAEVRLLRDNVIIYTGKVGSLRRFKDDVSEVKQGFECGVSIANFNDLKEGDVIEFFVVEEVAAQTL